MKIRQDRKYKHMYWVVWPDGTKSQDFYNLSRAKDICQNVELYLKNTAQAGKQVGWSELEGP